MRQRLPAGFSYVQLLLVITLLVILAGAASPYYLSWQTRQQARTTSTMLWSDLHYTQSRSIQLEQGDSWGIHIDNTAHQYVIFRGASYSSSDTYNETITYPTGVTISPSSDIVFSGLTGTTTATTLTITPAALPSAAETITINAQGLITQ